jgi:hypothetical protein
MAMKIAAIIGKREVIFHSPEKNRLIGACAIRPARTGPRAEGSDRIP